MIWLFLLSALRKWKRHVYLLYLPFMRNCQLTSVLKVDLRLLALQNMAEIQTASTNRRGTIPYFKVTMRWMIGESNWQKSLFICGARGAKYDIYSPTTDFGLRCPRIYFPLQGTIDFYGAEHNI